MTQRSAPHRSRPGAVIAVRRGGAWGVAATMTVLLKPGRTGTPIRVRAIRDVTNALDADIPRGLAGLASSTLDQVTRTRRPETMPLPSPEGRQCQGSTRLARSFPCA